MPVGGARAPSHRTRRGRFSIFKCRKVQSMAGRGAGSGLSEGAGGGRGNGMFRQAGGGSRAPPPPGVGGGRGGGGRGMPPQAGALDRSGGSRRSGNPETEKAPVVIARRDDQLPLQITSSAPLSANATGRRVLELLKPQGANHAGDSSGVRVHAREWDVYGVIVALKEGFGFIQAIYDDEQYHFSERDFYMNIKLGDKVAFMPRDSAKGKSALNLRLVIPALTKCTPMAVRGTVTRTCDRHRSEWGLIEVDMSTLNNEELKKFLESKYRKQVAYRTTDIVTSSLPRHHTLEKGDVVEFFISNMHDSHLYLATEVHFKQLKRDRQLAIEVQRMIDAGIVREIGVVTVVKNKEFGFIRAQDRKEELFFRVNDVMDATPVKEGMEVQFFVVAEMLRGKLCDRAMHLMPIPPGTVQFETVVGKSLLATVTAECGVNDAPGHAVLAEPLDLSSLLANAPKSADGSIVSRVDIWQRCLPEELQLRVGDVLTGDVHFYRPEKLFFLRSVRVMTFLPAGRDVGMITAVKDATSFGFINSVKRKMDLYFRMSCVLDNKGYPLVFTTGGSTPPPEEADKSSVSTTINLQAIVRAKVSFDVVYDESTGKLRATRVQLIDNVQNGRVKAVDNEDSSLVMQKEVIGVTVRAAPAKKDSLGLIKMNESDWRRVHEIQFVDKRYEQEADAFMNCSELQSIEITACPVYLQKLYTIAFEKYKHEVVFELKSISVDSAMHNTLRIVKHKSSVPPEAAAEDSVHAQAAKTSLAATVKVPKEGFTIPYLREDVLATDVNSLSNDMEVVFDVCWDRILRKRLARNIRITEEPIENETQRRTGSIEMITSRTDRFGLIRTIPDDEKLLFSNHSFAKKSSGDPSSKSTDGVFQTGDVISFVIRRRGGLRWAMDICEAPDSHASTEILSAADGTPSSAVAVAIDDKHAIVVEVSDGSMLADRYLSLQAINDAAQSVRASQLWSRTTKPAAISEEVPVGSALDSPTAMGSDSISAVDAAESAVAIGDVSSAAPARLAYPPKYFDGLNRIPTTILTADGSSVRPAPGQFFRCNVVMNWAKSSCPVGVIPLEILSTREPAVKREGRVSKLRFRMSSSSEASTEPSGSRASLQNAEFVEVLDVKDASQGSLGNVSHSVCIFNDLQSSTDDYTRESLHMNDDVEFWTAPSLGCVAIGARISPKMQFQELKFKQNPGVNVDLKVQKAMSTGAAVHTNVIMAKGPPNDSAIGFEKGWREIDVNAVSALPWASMLTHLTTVN